MITNSTFLSVQLNASLLQKSDTKKEKGKGSEDLRLGPYSVLLVESY